MKTLELKQVSEVVCTENLLVVVNQADGTVQEGRFTAQEASVTFSTAELLKAIVNTSKEGGLLPEEMGERIELLKVIKSSTDKIELTDSQVDLLKANIASKRWAVAAEFIVDFTNDIKAL